MKRPRHSVIVTSAAAFAIALALSACHDDASAGSTMASQLATAEKESSRLTNEMKLLREDFEKKFGEVLHQNEELHKTNDDLRQQLEQAQDQVDKTKKQLEEHMAKYRVGVRARGKGVEIPHLETVDHQAFDNVVVSTVTTTELKFTHASGSAAIPFERLSPAVQERFGYDAGDVKRIALAEVAAKAAAEAAAHPASPVKPAAPRILTVTPGTNDPAVVGRLQERISVREAEIRKLEVEAEDVKASPYGSSSLGRVRMEYLAKRATVLRGEIDDLKYMLDRVVNG